MAHRPQLFDLTAVRVNIVSKGITNNQGLGRGPYMNDCYLYHWERQCIPGKTDARKLNGKARGLDSHILDLRNFDQHDPENIWQSNPQGNDPRR